MNSESAEIDKDKVRQADEQTDAERYTRTNVDIDRYVEGKTDRQTDRQTDRRTDRQTGMWKASL